MAQETRKDPRAKVLTVTVRYKSATLDEFIEHHSHDVSRGGMFIKTVSPFPPGTLLKIEVRIAGDQRVMQGVGRVVWKRESGEQHDGAPAGMGVKFIKIDDASRGVIDQLVAKSGGAVSAFDKGGDGTGVPAAAAVAEPPAAKPAMRKATMIGLGAMASEPPPAADTKAETQSNAPFFPASDGAIEQPAPEDRTVMKQAAELLQDALREAGGSLDEVGTPGAASHPPPPVYEAPRPKTKSGEPPPPAAGRPATESKTSEKPPAAKVDSVAPKTSEKPPASAKPAEARPAGGANRPSTSPRPPTTTSASRRAPVAAQPVATKDSGGGRVMVIVLALVAVIGGIIMLTRKGDEAPPAATDDTKAAAPPAPSAAPAADTAKAPSEPTPPPVALSALPAETAAPTAPAPVASAAPPPPVAEVKKPKPVVAKPVAPKPAATPVAPVAPTTPVAAEPKAPAEPTAAAPEPAPAPEPKPAPVPTEAKAPAEPKPPAEAKPPAEPKPAPAPKPKKSDSDNPF